VIVRVGAAAGMPILIAILGFPFFVFFLVAELMPSLSSAAMISSICESADVSFDSLALSA
jgi:hypothetical protein